MLFGFAVRSIYMESCCMFVRGGVYVVVRDSLGPGWPSSRSRRWWWTTFSPGRFSVSAGQYLGRLVNELAETTHSSFRLNPNYFAAFFGVAVTIYFWWQNIKGIHESSSKALRIMQITTVMVVVLLIWCGITLAFQPKVELPPLPTVENLQFDSTLAGLARAARSGPRSGWRR